MTINELADKFYEDFKDEKLKGSLEEFVKLAFRTGYMKGHMIGFSKTSITVIDETASFNPKWFDDINKKYSK